MEWDAEGKQTGIGEETAVRGNLKIVLLLVTGIGQFVSHTYLF